MRLFHTSDWHLGQSLHGQERDFEHACFLDWLLGQLRLRQPDALLIAGDIFDTVNPRSKPRSVCTTSSSRRMSSSPSWTS